MHELECFFGVTMFLGPQRCVVSFYSCTFYAQKKYFSVEVAKCSTNNVLAYLNYSSKFAHKYTVKTISLACILSSLKCLAVFWCSCFGVAMIKLSSFDV